MSDSDADEYVYLGTPLQGSDKVALPVNQQTVRDAAGRQRFHGAFTGGYSAGFFNTTGSQAGFNPATFTSSRGKRANQQQQNVADFLDEDELEELAEKGLQAKAEYDTFQTDSTAKSHTQAADQAAARHGLNLFPEEALKPVVSSIGVQLLQKMGWKQESNNLEQMGYDLSTATAQNEPVQRTKKRRWGPMTGLQIQNAQFVRLKQKENTYGLGYDPYAQSEELRTAKKRMREDAGLAQRHAVDNKGRRARGTAFAASVLEESEFYGGDFEDYADDVDPRAGMHFEVVSSEDDADDVPGARRKSPHRVEGSAPTVLLKARQGTMGRDSFIEGYVRGSMHQPAVVESTRLPARIQPTRHIFEHPCSKLYGALRQQSAAPVAAAAVPPPTDKDLKQRIDLAAASLARGGNELAEFLRRTHAGDKGYAFLDGGEGSAYFQYRTQQIRDALTRATRAVLRATVPQLQQGAANTTQAQAAASHEDQRKLTVEQRRNMLAEATLAGSTEPAKHQQAAQKHEHAPGATADARAELLAQAEMAGVVRKGASLASRFVKAGQGPSEPASDAAPSSSGVPSAGMLPPTRTKSEWIPSTLVCRCWNVPRPKPSESAQQGGATGRELLAVPAAQRGDVYADALPDFMKPRSHGDSGPPVPQQQLPPPPPRAPGAHTTATAAADGADGAAVAKDDLDQAADDLLASIQADMAEEVEQAAPEPEELPFEKPLDVFNAIFNETDSEDEDGSEEDREEQPAEDRNKNEAQEVEPKRDGGTAGIQQAGRSRAAGAGTAHKDAAAQLQEAQKAAVLAALDGGDPAMPSTSSGDGAQWHQEPAEAAACGSPPRSDEEAERHGRRARKKSKRDKSKDKDSDRRKKRHKYEDRQERRDRSDRDLLHNATALLSGEVLAQNVSTAEIMAVAAQLKKQSKKDKDKKRKHSSSKHHKRRREHSP